MKEAKQIHSFIQAAVILSIALAFSVSGADIAPNIGVTATFDTIYVDDDGGADYTTIQDAIDAATNGDTIYIYEGVYAEGLIVDKELTLTGESKAGVINDCPVGVDHLLVNSDNVAIEKISFIRSSMDFQVDGIILDGVTGVSFTDCFIGNTGPASRSVYIDGTAVGCADLSFVNCDFEMGKIGLAGQNFSGLLIFNSTFHIMTSGAIDFRRDCNDITIEHCDIAGNTWGISMGEITGSAAYPVENVDIIDCTIHPYASSLSIGITYVGNYVDVLGCNISHTGLDAIAIGGSGNRVINNRIAHGVHGVSVNLGSLNSVHHNTFIDLMTPIYIPIGSMTKNKLDDGYEGNYWDDYEEKYPDATNNGVIWDTPYEINNNNIDYYPLVAWKPAPPQVTLLYPNGEELLGGDVEIQWSEVSTVYGDIVDGAEIRLDYSVDGGDWQPIAAGLEDTGSYIWNTTEADLDDNYNYLIRVGASFEGETGYDASDEEFAIDATPPKLNITRPLKGQILLLDSILVTIPALPTIAIGSPVTFVANAEDDMSGVDHVLFELGDSYSFDDFDAPFSWAFTNRTIGKRTLTVTAYDMSGLESTTTTDIFIINPLGG